LFRRKRSGARNAAERKGSEGSRVDLKPGNDMTRKGSGEGRS